MKKQVFVSVILLVTTLAGFAHAPKDTCKVGIYINSLYNLDLEDKSFMADLWIWQIYRNNELNFENALEITNSKSAEFSHYNNEKKGSLNWVTEKCKVQVMQDWNVATFPFDRQTLRIEIEDSKYDTSKIIYIADTVNSQINKTFNAKEWQLEHFSIKNEVHTYETTYGDPTLSGNSAYPRIVVEIQIKRNNSWRMLAKMLTGAYVAFLISCLVFFVSSVNQDSRFALCVGGLFAAIGNKYIVESVVPSTTTHTLMDTVHIVTFMFILLIVGIIIISLFLFESGNERNRKLSLKIDRWAFFSIIILYTLINVILIYHALP
jgi:hypothetical protein